MKLFASNFKSKLLCYGSYTLSPDPSICDYCTCKQVFIKFCRKLRIPVFVVLAKFSLIISKPQLCLLNHPSTIKKNFFVSDYFNVRYHFWYTPNIVPLRRRPCRCLVLSQLRCAGIFLTRVSPPKRIHPDMIRRTINHKHSQPLSTSQLCHQPQTHQFSFKYPPTNFANLHRTSPNPSRFFCPTNLLPFPS